MILRCEIGTQVKVSREENTQHNRIESLLLKPLAIHPGPRLLCAHSEQGDGGCWADQANQGAAVSGIQR